MVLQQEQEESQRKNFLPELEDDYIQILSTKEKEQLMNLEMNI